MKIFRKKLHYIRGLKAGIPIALGYLSVSFTFGIMAVSYGFTWWQALLISAFNITSAGQFAGIGIMLTPGNYLEMVITQITINIRYSFMSISLSQKVDDKFKGVSRWILGFGTTDEIFAVSMTEEKVCRSYYAGLITLPFLGWTLGTLFGAVLGNVLPDRLVSALGLAIYGMFIAIVVPEMKKMKAVVYVVALSMAMSSFFYYCPMGQKLSSGLSMSICAVFAAVIGAFCFPVKEEE